MWYNSQAVATKGSERSLKIEQQEEKYKAKQSAKYILVKEELYILIQK